MRATVLLLLRGMEQSHDIHMLSLLVLHHDRSDGESRSSLLRALETKNRQAMTACSVLRWCSQTVISRVRVALSGIRQARLWCCRTLNSISATAHPSHSL